MLKVNPRRVIFIKLVFLLALFNPSWTLAEDADKFEIIFNRDSLIDIKVSGNKLTYVWHVMNPKPDKDGMVALSQSLRSYDRYELTVDLTIEEAQRFRDWIHQHHLLETPSTFEESEPPPFQRYGAET